LKAGSLNLLEPSGTVQACDGIALPFSGGAASKHLRQETPKYMTDKKNHKEEFLLIK
jgi:hypothetical protein